MFVGCSSSPNNKNKVVTFKFIDDSGENPIAIGTYSKTFTEDKWDEVLKQDKPIAFETKEYVMSFDEMWIFYDDFIPYFLYSNSNFSIALKGNEEIKNGITVYCVFFG